MRIEWPILMVAVAYFCSSLVHGPVDHHEVEGVPHWRPVGLLVLALPRVLSGDSPHYLVGVNSLIEDGDFDLTNNYRQAKEGDLDAGVRFRQRDLDRHVDRDNEGRVLGTHSPFFVLLLATLTWPLQGTAWVEPVCIGLTMLVGLAGVALSGRLFGRPGTVSRQVWVLTLGLATPLWCYSRDLWAEPWLLGIWGGLLVWEKPVLLGVLAALGTLIKYPFALVPISMALMAFGRGDHQRGWTLGGSALAALLLVVGTVQYLFQDVDHFSLFHSGIHVGFDWPWDGLAGLLLGPENGILFFSPFLAWGLRKGGDVYLPAMVFFLFHATYQDWAGGTGFSARYLVPALPGMILAVKEGRPRGWVFKTALVYSFLWGLAAGLFPSLVYDRTPWEVILHVANFFF